MKKSDEILPASFLIKLELRWWAERARKAIAREFRLCLLFQGTPYCEIFEERMGHLVIRRDVLSGLLPEHDLKP